MIKEKSCGAVIYRTVDGTRQYFLLLNRKNNAKGHWGFPKGHTEAGENEYETASR
ncbi:MAG: NUDIX domain-containing protein, partial [Clostridia bacterium]|nr:NUDIX domain-containing protein [Clostridia bacterium]